MSLLRLDRLHYCILMSMGCISSPLVWAEDLNSDVAQLPTLHVEATRTDTGYLQTPASVFRIEAPQVDSSSQVNLTEVVKGIPSLQIRNRENYAQDLQLSMRGFGARSTFGVRGIRLYVDGIPATMPDGQGQTSNIDLSSLDHVEVLTGPFSSLYGNSSGGTILTSTKEGQGKDSIELSYSGGSHDKSRAGLVLQGGAKGANEPSYIISSSYFDTDGYREHSGAEKVLNNAKLSWNLDDGSKINWVTNYVKIHADDPQGLTHDQWNANPKQQVPFLKQFNVRKDIEQTQTGVTWSKPINDKNELYAMAYLGNRQVTQYQSIPKSTQDASINHAGGVIDFERNYYGADFRWTGKELLPNTTLSVGVALDAMDEDRKGFENFNLVNGQPSYGVKGNLRRDEDNTLWNIDPYLQASWQFLPTWRLDTGVRYSNVHYKSEDNYLSNGDDSGKTDYDKVLPSVALSWQILPELMAYVSYAKGFETPTFTEMAYRPDGQSGFNFDLTASTSDTYETGLKSQNQLGDFTLAVFQTKTKDDIVSAGNSNGRSTFRNADKTLREGVEFAWNKKLWRDLIATASYSYLDATFDADIPALGNIAQISSGNAIPGIAKNQAYASLAWQPSHGLYGGVDVQYMDKVYVNDTNSDAAPSYSVTSANVGYAWVMGDWKVNSFARVDNLFDKKYVGSVIVNDGNSRYFEPADGRNWSAGLRVIKQF
ncbi:TPA: TonB-dependent receptor [Acinetobacter baumannii]|uniref:TonB-dependent receptor n=8 Tax=Acinetobacter baumannii TaxID=470 RepID=A0AAX1IYQ8_ACIBA|nr:MULTISPECIES: TonB-dependent receptor [Acinetobacter]KCW29788.1 tonB dependent receptor family protein [Acinetobacter baumannii 6935]KCY93187.1 tonB dependent receptor family protein [Acinetobacter baumannii 929679-598]ACC58389.1 Outer membrane receptor protein, mostly Fe transport [Acinetobacter baumannii ACICU]AML68281.1 TonB-dependent receptor [Acinetobacter baumannii]AOP64655.1 Putative TonB-dependent receptor yncD [Acinetobacter baumannii DU202]